MGHGLVFLALFCFFYKFIAFSTRIHTWSIWKSKIKTCLLLFFRITPSFPHGSSKNANLTILVQFANILRKNHLVSFKKIWRKLGWNISVVPAISNGSNDWIVSISNQKPMELGIWVHYPNFIDALNIDVRLNCVYLNEKGVKQLKQR